MEPNDEAGAARGWGRLGGGGRSYAWLTGVLVVAVVAVVVQNAWVCDDAFITWRCIDNLLEGRGLVYNPDERVQVYTHPLWLLVLAVSHVVTREVFFTTIATGTIATGVALWVLAFGVGRPGPSAVVVLLAASLSRAFVEFSTSGLENPLSHVVLAAAAWVHYRGTPGRRTLQWSVLCLGLAVLTRPDLALATLPLSIAAGLQARRQSSISWRKVARACAVGLLPLFAWELFSLVYYGSLVPNTALAKLGVGIPRAELVARGGQYLLVSTRADPVTSVVILAALGFAVSRRDARWYPLAWGIVLHLVYVVWIGGDFMAGRFLTVPFFVALIVLRCVRWGPGFTGRARQLPSGARGGLIARWGVLAAVGATLVGLAFAGERPPPLTTPAADAPDTQPRYEHGVTNERDHYAQAASLLAWRPGRSMPDHRWRRMAQRGPGAGHLVEVFPNLGYFGYYAWPELHIIDPHALADPLLARLPALRRIEWRAGHFARAMPPGYLETRRTGRNALRDPVLVELHEALTRVHRGPIFSAARFADIVRLHTGHYERAIDFDRYRYAKALHVRVSLDEGMTRAVEIDASGVFVELGERRRDRRLEIECSGDDAYRLRFLAQGDQMGAVDLPAHEQTGLSSRSVDVPSSVAAHGYDELHLMPLTLVDKTHAVLAQLRR